jgi:hypothetical protein
VITPPGEGLGSAPSLVLAFVLFVLLFAVAKSIAKAALVGGVGVFPVRGRMNKGTKRAGPFILVELLPSDFPRRFVEAFLGGNLLLRFRRVPPASDPISQLHGRKIDRLCAIDPDNAGFLLTSQLVELRRA